MLKWNDRVESLQSNRGICIDKAVEYVEIISMIYKSDGKGFITFHNNQESGLPPMDGSCYDHSNRVR